jgi:hypothetical protein
MNSASCLSTNGFTFFNTLDYTLTNVTPLTNLLDVAVEFTTRLASFSFTLVNFLLTLVDNV